MLVLVAYVRFHKELYVFVVVGVGVVGEGLMCMYLRDICICVHVKSTIYFDVASYKLLYLINFIVALCNTW